MLYAPEYPDAETLRVPVLRVFDGDGFLTRIRVAPLNRDIEAAVRFGFIDAPEMDQPGGREARDFLNSLIGGRWLDLVILMKMDTGRSIDAHGRIVAVPYLREGPEAPQSSSVLRRLVAPFARASFMSRNIELEMVLNGWAWVLDRYGPDERYFHALEDAQRDRRGIWAQDDNMHPWEFKKQKHRRRAGRDHNSGNELNLSYAERPVIRCLSEGCSGHLVKRSGKYGNFYGCSEFPRCRYSRNCTD